MYSSTESINFSKLIWHTLCAIDVYSCLRLNWTMPRGFISAATGENHSIPFSYSEPLGNRKSARLTGCPSLVGQDQGGHYRILGHLQRKELDTHVRPLLAPPARASPGTLALFAGKEPALPPFNQQGRH